MTSGHLVLHLALFICDYPAPTIMASYGDYTKLFPDLFSDGLKKHNALHETQVSIQWSFFDVMKGVYPTSLDNFHAVIITGSKYSAVGNEPWIIQLRAYIKESQILNETHPCKWIGICFGHQIIAEALGGKVQQNEKGWEVGWTALSVADASAKQFYDLPADTIRLHSMHQDIVTSLPPGFENLLCTQVAQVQSLHYKHKVVTIQAHPEYFADFVHSVIELRLQNGIFTPAFVEKVKKVLYNETDSEWYAAFLIKFILLKE